MTDFHIVDTNVPIAANNRAGENTLSDGCVLACVRFLRELMTSGAIVLDDSWEAIREYQHKLRSAGQPGVGDAFLKWVLTNQANPAKCRLVNAMSAKIPEILADFDPADVKFIRMAVAAPDASIAQAGDSLWWKRRRDFEVTGILVRFLCPEDIRERSDRKHGA